MIQIFWKDRVLLIEVDEFPRERESGGCWNRDL